ncbi:MAG: DUF4139 domain-containing protein [Myxococcota bacterium]
MKNLLSAALFAFSVCFSVSASADEAKEFESDSKERKTVAVTIYNQDLALVREVRSVKLGEGTFALAFMGVASTIDPTSVHLTSLTSPGALSVLEQNYEFDLISPAKLLDKFVGKKVTLIERIADGKERIVRDAELISTNSGTVYKIGDSIHLNFPGEVALSQIPENLRARPTLVWLLKNDGVKKQDIEVSYLASGISWKSDYVVVVNESDTKIDMTGWVTISNNSGATYQNAALKLIAGDVNRVYDQSSRRMRYSMTYEMAAKAEAEPQFEEKAFFEYHIYKLNRPATIKENQTKQMTLLSADGVSVNKKYLFRGMPTFYWYRYEGETKGKVGVYLEFKNSKENRLGIPLPKGKIRVYKADADGAQQFVGEDMIDHTPKDEDVKVKLGEAFDIVGEHKQLSFKQLSKYVVEEEFEIKIRNHKKEKIVVECEEKLSGEWEITEKTHPYEKKDAWTVIFKVPVKPDEEAIVKYKVRSKNQ